MPAMQFNLSLVLHALQTFWTLRRGWFVSQRLDGSRMDSPGPIQMHPPALCGGWTNQGRVTLTAHALWPCVQLQSAFYLSIVGLPLAAKKADAMRGTESWWWRKRRKIRNHSGVDALLLFLSVYFALRFVLECSKIYTQCFKISVQVFFICTNHGTNWMLG
jgi:hypothetical protein